MTTLYFHPESGLPMAPDAAGVFRVLAALPPRPVCALPTFGAVHPLLPRNQWRAGSLRAFAMPVLDQQQTSACVGYSSAAAFTRAWQASGQVGHNFSPTWIYSQINNGRDAGAVVADALLAMRDAGVALAEDVPAGALYRTQMPAQAVAGARRFRIEDAFQCRSFDEVGSALSLGFTCVSGILVGTAFMRSPLDSEDVAALSRDVQGGHALCHLGLKRSRSGEWLVETQNSWGRVWGDQGYCYLREQHFTFGQQQLDAFALTAPMDDPLETESDPPVVIAA